MKLCLITLGCPKNTVEGEKLAGLIEKHGWSLTTKLDGADAAVIHTCSFIKDAKEESMQGIASLSELKKSGAIGKLFVTGCLVQEERSTLRGRFPLVDGILGTGELEKLPAMLSGRKQDLTFEPGGLLDTNAPRLLSSDIPSAYLRIAEGCDHTCSFCAIPSLRGGYKSREMGNITGEATELARRGIKELVLIAQDTTFYGKDIYSAFRLPALLRKLAAIDGIEWIRILYAYPDTLTDEMLETIGLEPKICKYLDIPLQHVSAGVLRKMRRKPGGLQLIRKIKSRFPDMALRTTFITGFPGETKKDFSELLEAVSGGWFDHVGVFEFSPHPGTRSFGMPGKISEAVKKERKKELMLMQRNVVRAKNKSLAGSLQKVLVEGVLKGGNYVGRASFQAPEIDNLVYFSGKPKPGPFQRVKITGYKGYDLTGKII
ncbi:MAG: 30S ribosomal protein S12 methylthiotransferase RimO [Elusimicrobiota bacterium]